MHYDTLAELVSSKQAFVIPPYNILNTACIHRPTLSPKGPSVPVAVSWLAKNTPCSHNTAHDNTSAHDRTAMCSKHATNSLKQ